MQAPVRTARTHAVSSTSKMAFFPFPPGANYSCYSPVKESNGMPRYQKENARMDLLMILQHALVALG